MRRTHSFQRRAGAVLPLVAICLVGLLGFVALAIDVGMMAVARTQAQAAADIGSLSGARTLNGKDANNNKTLAEAEAREAITNNDILSSSITTAQVSNVRVGVYRYNTSIQRFQADFSTAPAANESYGAAQVVITTAQPTYFGRVLGVNSMTVSAMATAVHRPRDIAIILDFSGSMRFSSEFNYDGGSTITGSLNADSRRPLFGPWSIFTTATNNPMYKTSAYIDSSGNGETHAINNLTSTTANGPAIVTNFQTTTGSSTSAFTANPDAWSIQFGGSYDGDRWPHKSGQYGANPPSSSNYARTVAEMLGVTSPGNGTINTTWETNGYDWTNLSFRNGAFKGYSMGPAYYGKTFYVWPPDPRYNTAADPTTVHATNTAQDSTGKWIADWRKRFFLKPGSNATTKGGVVDNNTILYTTGGLWQNQYVTSNNVTTTRYVPNYNAILKWIKTGPQTLPASLRAGRVLYYSSIPDTIPIDWNTGLLNTSNVSLDQRFWKEYIDFVLGTGRHDRTKTLYGYGTSSFNSSNVINSAANLTGSPKPYMHYGDSPVHPRLHMWFGPLTMLGFLAVDSNNLSYNWYAGTTYEAQTWQLKAGIQSALEDIKNNHPNDLAALTYFSSHNGYNSARVAMGKNYTKMKNCLFYPYSLVDTLGTVGNEIRPYSTNTVSYSSPCGLNPNNYAANVPNADGGTNPSMGLMVAYNEFNWNGGYAGRRGATKMVILETDGVANQNITATYTSIGSGNYKWTSIANAGISNATPTTNGHPSALNPAVSLAWLISQDAGGTKSFPNLPGYTTHSALPAAAAPTRWSGLPTTIAGYSTTRQNATIHTIAFGELFESTTVTPAKTRALEFLRNVQMAGGLSADATTGTIEDYKMITGDYNTRIEKLRSCFERIMQGGIQVALIQ